MNFNAETAGGYNEEVMFMKDDEETFLLLISWDELMIAFKHEF